MNRLERFLIHLSTLIVGVSGILYGVMKYLMTSNDPFSVINHPLQPWMLDLHVVGAPVLVFAIGLIAREHIVCQMRKGRGRPGRASGLFAVGCLLPMISTGYLIQIFTNETARQVSVVVHLTTSGIYLLAFVAHLAVSRRSAARRRAASLAAPLRTAVEAWERRRVARRAL